MATYKMHRCGYCGRTHRCYIGVTHGQHYQGTCPCGAEYASINDGGTWYCIHAPREELEANV